MATYTREILEKQKVTDLRDILESLGRRKTGTKRVLIDRILDAQNVVNGEVKGEKQSIPKPGSKMYAGSDVLRDISKAVENSILPSSSRSEIDKILKNKTLKWDDKIDGVPKLSLGWVTNYLTGEPASKMSTHDQQPDWSDMHRRVLDRADGLFNAGKVTRVLCSNSEADDIVNVKCTCGASMKQQTYTVMLQFLNKRTPVVESAHCTCLAGLSQKCGHVGALLLALLECQKKGYSSMSCTSRDPSWPAPASKKTESCQVSDLVIEKKSVSKTPRTKEVSATKFEAIVRTEQTDIDRHNFAMEYATLVQDCTFVRYSRKTTKSGAHDGICCVNDINVVHEEEVKTCVDIPHPKLPVCIKHTNESCNCKLDVSDFSDAVIVDFHQAHEIEKSTRCQSECSRWIEERKPRLTSSNFGKIIKRRKSVDSDFLLSLYNPKCLDKIKSVQFGREHEGDAADALMQHVYEEYGDRNIVLYHSGLVINPLMPFLAASPDRILYIEGEGYFVVELKSSLKSENLKQCPTELADASNYYLTVDEEDTVILDREHNYYFQVLGQMAVCNLKKAFFGVWSSYGCHIEQIEFDQVVWDECYEKLQSFYTKHYMKFVNSQ